MSLGLREDRRRRRRQARWALTKWLLALAVIGAAGVFAYETGSRLAQTQAARLQTDIDTLSARVAELEAQTRAQAEQVAAAEMQAQEWRQRYEREVPSGEPKVLFDLIQDRIARGASAERLRFVLEQVGTRSTCDARPQTRRVLVQTPLSRSAPAAFAGGGLTVALSGVSARDAAGNPEAWFDPAQPVRLTLTRPGGQTTETSAPLPLNPVVIHGDREYRLGIVAGTRGFAQVTVERCNFP